MAEYRRNLRGIFAKNGPARRNFGPERRGPAVIPARPARPTPLKFAGRNGPAQFVKPEIYNPGETHNILQHSEENYYGRIMAISAVFPISNPDRVGVQLRSVD